MQADRVDLLMTSYQTQVTIKSLIKVSHSVANDISIAGVQVPQMEAVRSIVSVAMNTVRIALTRTTNRGKLVRIVTLFCRKG